jgi:hypothetical protein
MSNFFQWQGHDSRGAGYTSRMNAHRATVYTSTATFSSGSTATSSNTFTLSAMFTASITTSSHEIFITNDGPYDVTATVFKIISAAATVNIDAGLAFLVPATIATAGGTVGGKGVQIQGLFNVDLGLIIRLTVTAAFTALVTNNVLIKELDL